MTKCCAKDDIFEILCFSLLFINIPEKLQLNFLGGIVSDKLCLYILIVGFIYTWKNPKLHMRDDPLFKKLIILSALYFVVTTISIVHGAIIYPYWDIALSAPINQIKKMPSVIAVLDTIGIQVAYQEIISVWIQLKEIKNLLLEIFWCFGGAFIVYLWWKNNWRRGIELFSRGVTLACVIALSYSVIEMFYLAGNVSAENFLIKITPYIHMVEVSQGWWPPLLWEGQMRMTFPEPSYVGNFIAFALPVLYCKFYRNTTIINALLIFLMSYFSFFTRARTAYAMLFGITILFILLVLINKHDRRYALKKILSLVIIITLSFVSYVWFINQFPIQGTYSTPKNGEIISSQEVLDNNLSSLKDENRRSNGARFAVLKSSIRIFLQHPIIGVGSGFQSQYIVDNFTQEEITNNSEVIKWVRNQKEHGPFSTAFAIQTTMNEYFTRLMNCGLLGLLVFLAPFIVLIYNLFRVYINTHGEDKINVLLLLTAIVGVLVSGCNQGISLFFAPWVLLGLGYAMLTNIMSLSQNKRESE